MLAVSVRNKEGFLTGAIPKPAQNDSLFVAWGRCNNLVISWLLKSISAPIISTVFFMDNAALIWKTLHQQFHQPNE